ncbi:MAG: beta-ketoacyl-ACP synthase III [Actinomycetota bacterium]
MPAGRYSRIAAVGSALPARTVPNSYFESIVDTSDEWIQERTGIKERRFAGPGESTATLSAGAAEKALSRAGVAPESVDLLIIATCTPERTIPSTAAFVQARLGMSCPSFDLNAACAGFVYGLSVADAQIRAGAADRVMLVGAEVLSRVLDMTDRSTCVLFGDGAGAALLEASDEPGIVDSLLALDGGQAELLTVPAGGSGEPITADTLEQRRNFLRMLDGQAVFKQAVTAMAEACRQVLEKAGLSPDDVKIAIGHQANARILTALGKRLGLNPEKVLIDIAHIGNTSAASIPIALDRAWSRGLVEPGDVVLTAAFGAGMAWGANAIRWSIPAPARGGPSEPISPERVNA